MLLIYHSKHRFNYIFNIMYCYNRVCMPTYNDSLKLQYFHGYNYTELYRTEQMKYDEPPIKINKLEYMRSKLNYS